MHAMCMLRNLSTYLLFMPLRSSHRWPNHSEETNVWWTYLHLPCHNHAVKSSCLYNPFSNPLNSSQLNILLDSLRIVLTSHCSLYITSTGTLWPTLLICCAETYHWRPFWLIWVIAFNRLFCTNTLYCIGYMFYSIWVTITLYFYSIYSHASPPF